MALEGLKHPKTEDMMEVDSPGLSEAVGFARVGKSTTKRA